MTLLKHISILALTVLSMASCSNTKHLPKGETLYIGSKTRIKDNAVDKKEKKVLLTDLNGVVRPKPNSEFLGIRWKLTIYNFAGVPKKKKGLRRWLREKVGEPPVLTSSVRLPNDKELMVNVLENRGFFYGRVAAKIDTDKKRRAVAVFDVTTGAQYKIKQSYYKKDSSDAISKDVDSIFAGTLLKPGSPYNLDVIKAERERIDRGLKEIGYFYFRPDYILVVVDTSIGDNKVNMYVKLKHRDIPPEAYKVFTINDIFIFANYKLRGKKEDTSKEGMVNVEGYNVIDKKKAFKPTVFAEAMVFEKGDRYSLDDQNTSLSRLVNMGTFKFVKNRFETSYDSLMNVYYYLTPYPKKSLRFEVGVLTQNDNRAGTEGSISWRNRNAFKGAEELVFKVNGGFEAQYAGAESLPTIYNFGLETDLSLPRFVVPFIDVHSESRYLPRTIIKLKYNYESESDLLRINSYTASYGYDWKQGPHKEHQFYPINFTYVKTDTLGTKGLDLLYQNLIFNGIILGPTYEYTYNSQAGAQRKNSFYFDGLIDLSGNILGLAQKADYKTNPELLFGSTYAQYVKLQPDFRYYLSLSKNTLIASRAIAGIGLPYGNSTQLPNIKEFWAGGNSDMRGFPSRLVGPGTFESDTSHFIETLGDLKMELNVELRQHIYSFLNLGLFIDAGNIWLYNNNPQLPGGAFTSNFYKEFAADAGFGLRFDFKILILRLDLGIPIRKPWLPENDRWVVNKIDVGDPDWRKHNMVFNIAIGYPF